MDDKGDLTLEEARFLYTLLWNNGCVNDTLVQIEAFDEEVVTLICPSWSDQATDPDGNLGSCVRRHRHKICVALELAARGEYIINIAPSDAPPVSESERRAELQQLIERKRELNNDIEEREKRRKELDEEIARLNT